MLRHAGPACPTSHSPIVPMSHSTPYIAAAPMTTARARLTIHPHAVATSGRSTDDDPRSAAARRSTQYWHSQPSIADGVRFTLHRL